MENKEASVILELMKSWACHSEKEALNKAIEVLEDKEEPYKKGYNDAIEDVTKALNDAIDDSNNDNLVPALKLVLEIKEEREG